MSFYITWSSKTSGSNITQLLNILKEDNCNLRTYLHIVKDPHIRQIFDYSLVHIVCMNVLEDIPAFRKKKEYVNYVTQIKLNL